MNTYRRAAVVALALLAMASGAVAQDYPARPITLVVPYAPGGTSEAIARRVMHRLELKLGKPIIIENRPGASTANAAAQVARAAPDGHTLLLATSTTLAINVTVHKNLTYDPVGDFAPVGLIAGVPFMLVVNPSLRVETVADLVRTSKAASGGLSYASTGYGSAAHLFAEMLKTMTGLEAVHVPYKGNAPGLNDVVAGHVQMMIGDFGTSHELSRAGRVRALGVTTATRVGAAPDIPTLAEAGVPGYDASAWQMIVVPAKTPEDIVMRLNAELRAILAEEDVQRAFIARGLIPIATPPVAELKSYIASEIVRWGEVVKKAGAAGIE